MQVLTSRVIGAALLGAACAAMPVRAAELFFDFENGQLAPWLSGVSGGSGLIEVTQHNASAMAHAQQSTGGWRALSLDFIYVGTETLSFDMQAYSQNYRAGGGVSVSFTDQFNVSVGSVQYYNLTDSSTLGTYGHYVDTAQHHYAASLRDWAASAGLAPATPISKVSVTFTGWSSGFSGSSGEVWFDNFRVTQVPEPGTGTLLGAGLAISALASRRRLQAGR